MSKPRMGTQVGATNSKRHISVSHEGRRTWSANNSSEQVLTEITLLIRGSKIHTSPLTKRKQQLLPRKKLQNTCLHFPEE